MEPLALLAPSSFVEIAGTIESEESALFVYVFVRKGIDRDKAKKAS